MNNFFDAESAVNYEQKSLCVLLLDVSYSMQGKRLESSQEKVEQNRARKPNFNEDYKNSDATSPNDQKESLIANKICLLIRFHLTEE